MEGFWIGDRLDYLPWSYVSRGLSLDRELGHAFSHGVNFFHANILPVTGKVVIRRQEQHTVAVFAFPHGDTRTVPIGGFHFGLFVLIVTAGTQRRAKIIFVFGESFNHHSRHGRVNAKVSTSTLGVGFRKMP